MSRLGRIAVFASGSALVSFAFAVSLLALFMLQYCRENSCEADWTLWSAFGWRRWATSLQISAGMLVGGIVSSSFGSSFPRALRIIQLTLLSVGIALPAACLLDALSHDNVWLSFQWILGLYFAVFGLPLLLASMFWAFIYVTIERRILRVPCAP
jgi:hypothetical protein